MQKPNPLYSWALQAPAPLRWGTGVVLIVGGSFGFLPVLGFWMIPLGVLFLAGGSPRVRAVAKAAIRRSSGWAGRLGERWRHRGTPGDRSHMGR